MNCFECGKAANHLHHVIPRIMGGEKTIPLCEFHHGLIHNINFENHSILTKEGLRKAKERGVQLGRQRKNDYNAILSLRMQGLSYTAIQKRLGVTRGAICRAVRSVSKTQSRL